MAARKTDNGFKPYVIYIDGQEWQLTSQREVEIPGTDQKVPVSGFDPDLFKKRLDYKERQAVKRLAREFTGQQDAITLDDFEMDDVIPALVTVVKRRQDANYKFDDATQLTEEELTARPPKQAAKAAA